MTRKDKLILLSLFFYVLGAVSLVVAVGGNSWTAFAAFMCIAYAGNLEERRKHV